MEWKRQHSCFSNFQDKSFRDNNVLVSLGNQKTIAQLPVEDPTVSLLHTQQATETTYQRNHLSTTLILLDNGHNSFTPYRHQEKDTHKFQYSKTPFSPLYILQQTSGYLYIWTSTFCQTTCISNSIYYNTNAFICIHSS